MENDPYSFGYQLEREAVKVLHKNGLAAFERAVRMRFEAKDSTEQVRRGWGEILRAIYAQQRDVRAYDVALCEQTAPFDPGLSCSCYHAQGATQARGRACLGGAGLLLDKEHPYESMTGRDLTKLRRELLIKLGRSGEALEAAWAEFQESPDRDSYEELMRFVPKPERAIRHTKAIDAAEHGKLGSLIELLMKPKRRNASFAACKRQATARLRVSATM
jgi:hypothetical protein